jgi:hypothetical protein
MREKASARLVLEKLSYFYKVKGLNKSASKFSVGERQDSFNLLIMGDWQVSHFFLLMAIGYS